MAYQSEVEKLEKQHQTNPDQYFAPLADAYRKSGNLDLAIEVVRTGLAKRPNYLSAHIVLGRCLIDQKNDAEATRVFEHVLELDAENIIALRFLAESAERSGDIENTRRWLKRLLDVDPANDDALDSLKRLEALAPTPPPAAVAPAPAEPEAPAPVMGFEPTAEPEPAFHAPAGLPPMGSETEFGIEQSSSPFDTHEPGKADMSALELESTEISFGDDGRVGSGGKIELQEPEPELVNLEAPAPENSAFPAAPEAPASFEPPMVSLADTPPPPAEPPVARRSGAALSPAQDLPLIMPDDSEPPARPSREAVPPPVADGEPEPVITETMAEVYVKQGLIAEARDVYRKLIQQRPGDAALRDRLASLDRRPTPEPMTSPAPAPAKPRFAVESGGVSARSLFGKVLSSRPGAASPAPEPPPPPPPPAPPAPPAPEPVSTMDAAFAEEPVHPTGAPTRPTSDELSLAAVFGEESTAPPPPRPAAPEEPAPGAPGFSFDEFFGGKRAPEPAPGAKADAAAPEGDGSTPDDFLTWLKGLKS